MCLTKLKETVFAIVDDDDPYKDPKRLQLEQWCTALLQPKLNCIFWSAEGEFDTFYLEALSDEECWAESDTPHGIKFNRRVAARKMVASVNSKGTENHLTLLVRYQFACVYCLEEDIHQLLDELEQEYPELRGRDSGIVVRLLGMSRQRGHIHDMTEFWSYYAIGDTEELNLEGENFYACGLKRVLSEWNGRVEAVEYFWDKIKSDNSLSDREKDEIFMNAAISAIGTGIHCDIFEFCFSQLSPVHYPEFLRREGGMNRRGMNKYYGSVPKLQIAYRFDLCRKIFDCLKPSDIEEDTYCFWLSFMKLEHCPDHYTGGAVELVMHMWTKVGFDRHRAYTLKEELGKDSSRQGDLLLPLVKGNYMQAVWTILGGVRDEVSRELFKEFLKCKRAEIIVDTLKDDEGSLTKFLSYKDG